MIKYSIIICFSFISYLNAQNFEIQYSAELRQELSEEIKEEMMKAGEYGREQVKMNEEPEAATYKMLISGKESSFTYIEKISNEQDPDKPVIKHAPAGFGTTYHNLTDSVTMKDFVVYDRKYHSLDPLKNWNWTITTETKEIMGYTLKKATAETETEIITAWYAPKIPIAHGPADYWGLPGLIFDIEFRHKQYPVIIKYYADSIKKLKNSPKINKPNQGELIRAEEIDAIFQEANEKRNQLWNNEQGIDKD